MIERALGFLGQEEDWLIEHKDENAAMIQEGWDEAECGELTDSDQAKAEI